MFVPLLPKRSGGQKATGSMRTGLCWTWPLPELALLVSSPQTLICCSRSLSPTTDMVTEGKPSELAKTKEVHQAYFG